MENPESTSEESPVQKQIRLRRERREAKIKAGGSARLDKITSLTGRPSPVPTAVQSTPILASPAASGVAINDNDDDPEEVDISNHRYTSAANPSSRSIPPPRLSSSPSSSSPSSDLLDRDSIAAQEAELRRLLRGERPPAGGGGGGEGGPNNNNMENLLFGPREGGFSAGQGQEEDLDPMRMLQQLMGGGGGGGEGGALPPGLPPGMAAMLGGMMPTPPPPSAAAGGGFAQSGQLADDNKNNDGYLWKIVHAVFALGLGIYITAMTTFSGAKASSSGATTTTTTTTTANVDVDEVRRFFWAFATAELVLQSTRFFLEKGRPSQSGWLGVLMGVLPEPYKGYLALGTRYGGIYTTVVQDAMAVLFVLGCVAWWKGAV